MSVWGSPVGTQAHENNKLTFARMTKRAAWLRSKSGGSLCESWIPAAESLPREASRFKKSSVYGLFSTSEIIPTRCRNSWLNEFCLGIICSCSSENFDSPYYRSCTMDAYQNLISSDKRYNERKVIIADGSRSSMSILQHNVTFLQSLLFGV